jgi:hypothetical protein
MDFIRHCGKRASRAAGLSTGGQTPVETNFHHIWESVSLKQLPVGVSSFYPHIHRPYYDYYLSSYKYKWENYTA